jgi:hypothetical protein
MPRKKNMTPCLVESCDGRNECKGYCRRHYSKWKHNGDANYVRQSTKGITTNTGKTHFKKGFTPWNKGLKNWATKEHKEAVKAANSKREAWNKGTRGLMPRPHNKIGDGVTPINKLEREKFRKTTQKIVFERDDYTCQVCLERGGSLQVDHIKRWADYPELRFDIDNCRTLCMACHYFVTFKKQIPKGLVWGHNFNRAKAGITS